MSEPTSLPSGWFPDPLDRYEHRYFNGVAWTSDVSSDGRRLIDPLGVAPGGSAGPDRPSGHNGAATAAVVMGSLALAIAWIPIIVVAGAALAVLALVFGTIGLRRSRTSGVGRGSSIAGIVMGALGIAASVVGVLFSIAVIREVVRFVEPADHLAEVTACEVDGRRAEVTGTIENLDDEPHDFTVFVEVGGRTAATSVDGVEPGDRADWSVRVTTGAPLSECDPDITVQGPFPYGVEVDPVR